MKKTNAAWKHYLALGIALLAFRAVIAEAYVIPSESMRPTFEIGDRVLVSKSTYGARLPFTTKKVDGDKAQRGEIAVFLDPKNPLGTPLIKRIIAIGGDWVAVDRSIIYINGQPVSRQPTTKACKTLMGESCIFFRETLGQRTYQTIEISQRSGPADQMTSRKVPPGHVFVMGDNRDNSNDSRFWGYVPYSHLVGKARLRFWSRDSETGIRWNRLFSPL
jgi:signal peptidase I